VHSLRKETEELLISLQENAGSENSMHEAIRDVSDTRHCVDDFLLRARGLQTVLASTLREDEQDLADMYLTARLVDKTARPTNDHAEVELLLEGILRRQDETVVTAEGLASQITTAERALELGLDATRNSLIFLEIKLDIVILGLTAMSAIYASFGMNLVSHFEEHPNAFYYTAFGAVALGLTFVRLGFRALSRAKRANLRLMGRGIHQRLPRGPVTRPDI
jgi:magnesium transporter